MITRYPFFYTLPVLFLLILIMGCKSSGSTTGVEVIPINIGNASDQMPELRVDNILKLGDDASLFGEAFYVEDVFDRIYTLVPFGNKSFMVFSKDGKFINKVEIGDGPQPIAWPFAFNYLAIDETIWVYDQGRQQIIVFDKDLNYVRTYTNPLPLIDFAVLNPAQLLVHSQFKKDFLFHQVDLEQGTVIKDFLPDFSHRGAIGIGRSIAINERVLLIAPFDFNIYEFSPQGEVIPRYFLDFGRLNIDHSELESQVGMENLNQLFEEGLRIYGPHQLSEDDRWLFFKTYYRGESLYFAYDKIRKEAINLGDYVKKGGLPKCTLFGINSASQFYGLIQPEDLIDYQNSTNRIWVDDIQLEHSPFLITFSLVP